MYFDYDSNKEFAKKHNIRRLPTYFVVLDDKVVLRTNSLATLKAYKPKRK